MVPSGVRLHRGPNPSRILDPGRYMLCEMKREVATVTPAQDGTRPEALLAVARR